MRFRYSVGFWWVITPFQCDAPFNDKKPKGKVDNRTYLPEDEWGTEAEASVQGTASRWTNQEAFRSETKSQTNNLNILTQRIGRSLQYPIVLTNVHSAVKTDIFTVPTTNILLWRSITPKVVMSLRVVVE